MIKASLLFLFQALCSYPGDNLKFRDGEHAYSYSHKTGASLLAALPEPCGIAGREWGIAVMRLLRPKGVIVGR